MSWLSRKDEKSSLSICRKEWSCDADRWPCPPLHLDDRRSRRWSMHPTRSALWRMCDPPEGLSGSWTDLLMLFSSDSQGMHCSNLLETAVRMTAVHVREASHTHRLRTVSRVRGRSRPPCVSREREGSCYPHERTMGCQRHPALQQLAGVKVASRKSF